MVLASQGRHTSKSCDCDDNPVYGIYRCDLDDESKEGESLVPFHM